MNAKLAVLALALVWSCGDGRSQAPSAPSKSPPEPSANVRKENPPTMPSTPQTHRSARTDAQLLAAGVHEDVVESLMDALTDTNAPGMLIDAPFAVDAGIDIPVHGALLRTPVHGESVERELSVVVVGLDRELFAATPALRKPKSKANRGEEDDDDEAGGLVGESFGFDLRERIGEQLLGPGVYSVHVVHRGLVSNGIRITVAGAEASQGARVSLRGPETGVTEPGGTIPMEGVAQAGSTVHLVGVGRTDPFHHAVTSADDGTFSVNLLGDNPLPKAPGTWHIYAFSGGSVAGPVTIELAPGETPW